MMMFNVNIEQEFILSVNAKWYCFKRSVVFPLLSFKHFPEEGFSLASTPS